MNPLTLTIPDGSINKATCQLAAESVESMLAERGRTLYDNIVIGEALVKIGEELSARARRVLTLRIEDGEAVEAEHASGKFSYIEGATSYDFGADPELTELQQALAIVKQGEADALKAYKTERERLAKAIEARQQWLVAKGSAKVTGKAAGQLRFTMSKEGK